MCPGFCSADVCADPPPRLISAVPDLTRGGRGCWLIGTSPRSIPLRCRSGGAEPRCEQCAGRGPLYAGEARPRCGWSWIPVRFHEPDPDQPASFSSRGAWANTSGISSDHEFEHVVDQSQQVLVTHLELSERVALRRVVCMYETGNRPPLSTQATGYGEITSKWRRAARLPRESAREKKLASTEPSG
jgi:hypothetical protein